jgi:ubiquinone/menaquinone biosynthesis C-methylase UbiE
MSVSDVRYDEIRVASEFDRVRDRRPESVDIWCRHIAAHLRATNGDDRPRLVVDVGSGTGIWSKAIADHCDVSVVGVEPSSGMRARAASTRRHSDVRYVAGSADSLPLRPASVSGAWLSTVIHQFPDLGAAARELRRVLVPGAPAIIRSSFPGRHDEHEHFQRFPAALEVASSWPRLGDVITAFEDAGFACDTLERVREPTFDSYDEFLELLPTMRRSDTALIGLDDDDWARGIADIRRARDRKERPWPLGLDLLVFS